MKLLNDQLRAENHGQALVVLLVFTIVSLTLAGAAAMVVLVNSQAATTVELGQEARTIAESGLENALLRLVRNPAYTGETLTVGTGSVRVDIVGDTTKTITATGTLGNFIRVVRAVATVASDTVTLVSWQEVF